MCPRPFRWRGTPSRASIRRWLNGRSCPRSSGPKRVRPSLFLVEGEGFAPPEDIDGGLRYLRADLMVRVWFLGGAESEVLTRLIRLAPDGTRGKGAWLDDLYKAAACGPAQDVPVFASTRRGVLRRVHQARGGVAQAAAPPPRAVTVPQASSSTSASVEELSRTRAVMGVRAR
ncbi:hypothetical protein ACRAWF_13005 [Streptomyces sp. L7]